MKKLIALLLVVCMIAGLFVACKKPVEADPTVTTAATEPTKTTEAAEASNPTEATELTLETEAAETTGATEMPEATEATEAPEVTTAMSESTKSTDAAKPTVKPVVKPSAKPTNASVATKATAATKVTTATKATESTKSTAATKATEATKPNTSTDTSFKGKTLQIYGMGSGTDFTDYSQFGNGSYLWMMRAAIEEWATENGVTIEFKGSYDQNRVISAINSGEKPDIIFQTGNFPAISNVGLTSPFTEDEVKQLSEICGTDKYFTMMSYKGQSHGFVYPWSGVSMLYYNKTIFDDYGVKTPKEYFAEGNWNWTTFQTCLEATTMDLDADGTVDTYGIASDSFANGGLYYSLIEDEKGNLISRMDEQITEDYCALLYEQVAINKTVQKPGKRNIQTNVIYPMVAMQIGDCEPYNFEHLYQSIPNGNVLEAVPVPVYDGEGGKEQVTLWTASCGSLAKSCDERAASIDLISYLLKVGMKYISDYSLGTVKCDYPGMKGTCDLSVQWKNAFAKVCKKRASAIKKIDGYDADFVAKINEYLENGTHYMRRKYANVNDLTSYSEIYEMPPESSIPAVRGKYQNMLNVYNNIYIG